MKALLSEMVDIVGGGTPSRKNPDFWDGSIPWATVKDFKDTRLSKTQESITQAGLDSSAANLIPEGQIIVPTRMAVGKVAVNSVALAINQDLKALLVKDAKIVDRDYLVCYLESKSRYLESRSKGATVKGITLDSLRELEVPLPPLSEQKRIAAILERADTIRRKRKQAIELTNKLLRSVFLEMFGDPVTNPKQWPQVAFSDLASFQNGAYFPRDRYTANTKSGAGTPMVHMSDAFYGMARIEGAKRVDVNEKEVAKYKLAATDLLVARRSLNWEGAAKPCRVPASAEAAIFESSLIRVRPDTRRVLTEFLYFYLSDVRARSKYLLKYITSSTISGINQSNLAKVMVLVPDMGAQEKFVAFLERLESSRQNLEVSLTQLESLASSLKQERFPGA